MATQKTSGTPEISKVYDPKSVEKRWYETWLSNGCFNAEVNSDKRPYTIVIPPPNVTSVLHIGHAFNNTVQDIFIRYRRKNGFEALWMPGTDHAGIATQSVVEKQLAKEGLTRHDLGREKFIERVWEWKEQSGSTIIRQLKEMGCSCDWRRERFTRDEEYTHSVQEVFIRLFDKGLIYRGQRIVNWDPQTATALSDEEVDHKDVNGKLYHIRYFLKDSDESIVVATTRPETLLGDTGVAIAPDDTEKQHLVGKTVIIPFVNREVPIFTDEHVDKDFGSGFVKTTPAHDPNDFDMGKRHGLDQILMLDPNGKVYEVCKKVEGSEITDELPIPESLAKLDRFEARKKIIAELDKMGQLVEIEEHAHSVGHSERSGVPVEPYLSSQWFVKMEELAKPALQAVLNNDIRLHPGDRWLKTYIHWMENIRDWCISRQLWWGHRIPVFYDDATGRCVAKQTIEEAREALGIDNVRQDEDVLDTWFSSWLWPFATMGWPKKTPELDYFYPTSTLATGPDIIFFWVARMIIAGYEFMDEKPFSDVYLNGIVRDDQGRKMSKSLGNGIDPLKIIETYSADALRSTLIMLSSEGQDINLSESNFEVGRNFSNKIWNSYRFLGMHLHNAPEENHSAYSEHFELADKWILSRLNNVIEQVGNRLEQFQVNDSFNAIYHFFWDEFCDWYLELIKARLFDDNNPTARKTALSVAKHIVRTCMHLLHPFIPFITEEIWQQLKSDQEGSIVTEAWPAVQATYLNDTAEKEMQFIQKAISAIRTTRSEMNVPPARKATLLYRTNDTTVENMLLENAGYIMQLAKIDKLEPLFEGQDLESTASLVIDGAELFIPLADLIDLDLERQRLTKEIERLTKQVMGLEKKLSNEDFLRKAPEQVVATDRNKLQSFTEKLAKVKANLERL